MLHKLLNVHKLKPFVRHALPKQALATQPQSRPEEDGTSILKIVHAGGHVESYYMAIPAAKILEKYPSFLLARPEVFKRPWDSVVKADEILTPGQKVLLVPRRTMRKLWRRIRKPNKEFSVNSYVSQSSMDVSGHTISQRKQGAAAFGELSDSSSICGIIGRQKSVGKKHVTFSGIDVKHSVGKKHVTFSGIDVKHRYKAGEMEHSTSSESSSSQSHGRKRTVRSAMTWQPSLTAITEARGADHIMKYE
ncbi:hypothetical protein CerSpe_121580 [Prunus speciosa]